jgi:hypothetical protein
MIGQPDVENLIRETKQYEFADGLRDLQLSLIWLAMGSMLWFVLERPDVWLVFAIRLADTLGNWARWTGMLLVLLPVLLVLAFQPLIVQARQRWLWRESGWVKPLPLVVPRYVTLISAAILLGSIFLAFTLYHFGLATSAFALRMLVIGTSWANGYSLVGLGHTTGLRRYVRLGMLGGLVLTPVLFLPLTFGKTWLIFGLWWGLLLAGSGIITLRGRLQAVRGESHDR